MPPPIEHRFGPPTGAPRPAPGRQPAPPRGRRRWGFLRVFAWTFGGFAVLAGAAIAALVMFAPVGIIREQLVREIKVRTGRDLVIAGRTSLSVWPSLAVSMGKVTLSSPPGMGGAPFVKMKGLEASVAMLPLLGRRVTIDKVVLSEPEFELRVDGQGRRSWDFAGLATLPTVQVAQAPRGKAADGSEQALPPELEDFVRNSSNGAAPPSAPPSSGRRGSSVQDVVFGDIRIDNGTVRYRDDRAGLSEEVRAINVRLTGKSLATPLEAKGSLVLRGDKVDIDARLGSPKALMEERPSRVALAIVTQRGGARYDGSLSLSKGPQLDGTMKLDTKSVRGLAQWIGASLPEGPGLGAFTLEGDFKSGPTWVALSNAKARLDDVNASGSVNIDFVGGRPNLKTNLKLSALDLNAYMPGLRAAERPAPAAVAPPRQGPQVSGPQVKGFAQRSGWSETPFDLAALGLLDAEAQLAIAGIAYQDVKIGASQITVGLKSRALRATLVDMRLYEGQGRGVVTLDGNAKVPAISVNLTLEGVSGLTLLKDAAHFDWIDGKGRVQIAVGGHGATERAIIESLNGKAELTFTDGAIVGFNIPQMVRGISQGKLSGLSRVPTERTDFSEAGASFQIKGGVAETKDIRALSPLIRLAGAGTVNLGQRQIDLTLRPKVVGTLTGQAGAAPAAGQPGMPQQSGVGDLGGLELPVRIRGPWEGPKIAADLDAVLKNPGQAVEAIKEFGRQIQQGKGGGLNQLIDQFKRR